ncbi:Lysosome-associated membrane glycoprotein 1 [Mactra antiquata]
MEFKIAINIVAFILCVLGSFLTVSADAVTPPTHNYTVTQNDVTCVVLNGGFQLVIPYTSNSKNYTTTVSVSNITTVNGTCDRNVNVLNIYFYKNWKLSFIFINTTVDHYSIGSINLTYGMTTSQFKNLSTTQVGQMITQSSDLPQNTSTGPFGGSYLCSGETTLSLNAGITLKIYNIQYRAFGKTKSGAFSQKNIENCLLSTPVPDMNTAAAVIVGIALGSMMVVVIVLYVIISKARGL